MDKEILKKLRGDAKNLKDLDKIFVELKSGDLTPNAIVTELISNVLGNFQQSANVVSEEPGYYAATWHFEKREELNREGTLPQTTDEIEALIKAGDSGWVLFGAGADTYHQYDFEDTSYLNINSNRNAKYANQDTGHEAVYDGYYNKGKLISNSLIRQEQNPEIQVNYINAKPTYNYITPVFPESWLNPEDVIKFIGTGIGHYAVDVTPYELGGNVRGTDPDKIKIKNRGK
jgi:hypothetical protein